MKVDEKNQALFTPLLRDSKKEKRKKNLYDVLNMIYRP